VGVDGVPIDRYSWGITSGQHNRRKEETMTTIKIETGNNESVVRGISKNSDGTFTAVTFSQSKTFKTLKGAQKWMAAKFS